MFRRIQFFIYIAIINLLFKNTFAQQSSNAHSSPTKNFNNHHKKDFYKLKIPRDTVELGSKYVVFVVIDTTLIRDLNKIKVLFYNTPLEHKSNEFKLSFVPARLGNLSYDISILNGTDQAADTVNISHSYYCRKPVASSNINYIALADKMPKFNSKIYSSFDDFLKKSILQKHIQVSGNLQIEYIAMIDGSTTFGQIRENNLKTYEDEFKIKKIVESYHGWNPGINNGRKVNVYLTSKLKFPQ